MTWLKCFDENNQEIYWLEYVLAMFHNLSNLNLAEVNNCVNIYATIKLPIIFEKEKYLKQNSDPVPYKCL